MYVSRAYLSIQSTCRLKLRYIPTARHTAAHIDQGPTVLGCLLGVEASMNALPVSEHR
jgi:hypothetical protein